MGWRRKRNNGTPNSTLRLSSAKCVYAHLAPEKCIVAFVTAAQAAGIGEIAADLAQYGSTRHDISLFQLARFYDRVVMASIRRSHLRTQVSTHPHTQVRTQTGAHSGAFARPLAPLGGERYLARSRGLSRPASPFARDRRQFSRLERRDRPNAYAEALFSPGISQAQADEWGYQLPEDVSTFW